MTFKVEFTPEAVADLERLFDCLLDRAETVEDVLRFDIRTPELVLGIGVRHQREEDFH